MTTIANKATIVTLKNLIANAVWDVRGSTLVSGTIPARDEIVAKLAALGVCSQTTGNVVSEADWRNADYGITGPLNSLFVVVHSDDGEDTFDVFAVFGYNADGTTDFTYC